MFTALEFVSDLQAFSPLISTCCKLTSTQEVFLRSEAETCKAYLYSYPGAVLPLNAEADEITGLHRPSGTASPPRSHPSLPPGKVLISTDHQALGFCFTSVNLQNVCVCAECGGRMTDTQKHKHRLHTLSWDLPPSIQENSGK